MGTAALAVRFFCLTRDMALRVQQPPAPAPKQVKAPLMPRGAFPFNAVGEAQPWTIAEEVWGLEVRKGLCYALTSAGPE